MGKKKWQDQADAYLSRILELLELYEHVTHIGQEPYKGTFFKVFFDAFRSGFCSPSYRFDSKLKRDVYCKSQRPIVSDDAIWSYAEEQGWVHAEIEEHEKRYQDVKRVMTWWEEWTYAWKQNPPPRKYTRGHSTD